MAKIKGIGIIGIVRALRSRRAEAEQKLSANLLRYLDDRIVIAQRKVRCIVRGDTQCEWQFDWEPTTGSGSR